MLKKYNSYIKESIILELELLLEGEIKASREFLSKIAKVSKSPGKAGKLAEIIYDFIDGAEYVNDEDIDQNYFDVTSKEDFISFLNPNKLPKDYEEDVDPSLPFRTKGRTEIKIGKVIRPLLKLIEDQSGDDFEFKDKDLEEFVNLYKSTKVDMKLKMKLISGEEIGKYYNSKKYAMKSGTLGGSCMSEEKKKVFHIYSKNDEKVQLLVLMDESEDKIWGRALVWKLKDSPCAAKYFMDRVYASRDSDVYKFIEVAKERGWLYKSIMNSYIEDNVKFIYNGSSLIGRITVKLDGDHDEYPFVDTLCFLDDKKELLSNVPYEDFSYLLHDVDGSADPCSSCDGKGKYDNTGFCGDCGRGLEALEKNS
jgi:hypothetical protein